MKERKKKRKVNIKKERSWFKKRKLKQKNKRSYCTNPKPT